MNNVITNQVNLILIIIGTFLGLVLGIFLLFNKSAKSSANFYLGILVLIPLTYFFQGFFYRFDLLEKFPHIIGTSKLANLLIGPLTYFYVCSCIQKGFKMRPILLLHFLPFVIFLFYLLPFFSLTGAEKIIYFKEFVQTGELRVHKRDLLIVSLQCIIYFAYSIRMIFQYKRHLGNTTSSIDYEIQSWLLVFIAIHSLPPIGLIIGFIFNDYSDYTLLIVLVSFFSFSVAVFFAILVKPELFHSFPHQMPIVKSGEEKTQKYESSNLQEERKEHYLKKLIQYVESNQPYLENELTLAQLSELTNISPHYLSQVINEKLNCNFLDFINGYRIEAAKNKLIDPKYDHYTIMAIAYEAGFNSKSAFYAVFKKQVGLTPSNYRKSLVSA